MLVFLFGKYAIFVFVGYLRKSIAWMIEILQRYLANEGIPN